MKLSRTICGVKLAGIVIAKNFLSESRSCATYTQTCIYEMPQVRKNMKIYAIAA